MEVSPIVHGLADLLPGKNPGSHLKLDRLHPRAARPDVWNKEKDLVHVSVRSHDLPTRGVVTSLFRLSYSAFLSANYVTMKLLIFCLNLSETALLIRLREGVQYLLTTYCTTCLFVINYFSDML